MKFARIGAPCEEKPVVMTSEETFVDISKLTVDINGLFLADLDLTTIEEYVNEEVDNG